MKITHTDIFRFSIRMEPFTIATGVMEYAQNVFIRVHTDEGFYGVGEASAFPVIVGETQETCLAMAKDFASIWKGKDPLDISARLDELNAFAAKNPTIKSAFDMALYDISAKAAGQPLYQFLGGAKKTVETDITIGIGTPEVMADTAVKYVESGATILKIKLGKYVKDDIVRMQQIKQSIDPSVKLRIDANQGWSFEDALYGLQAMGGMGIEFCEQPIRTWYDDLLPELTEKSPVKIMADESVYNFHDARRLIAAGACDYLNIKFAKSGGINEALKIQEIAAANEMACMMGGMLESRLALSAKLHFVYASPGVKFFDMDTCLIGQLEDPVVGGVSYNGYFLDIADAPGIGADVDEAFLRNCEKVTV